MLPEGKQEEDKALTYFHAMAQLRNEINKFVKVLEMEMKKTKGSLLALDEK